MEIANDGWMKLTKMMTGRKKKKRLESLKITKWYLLFLNNNGSEIKTKESSK